MKKNLIIPAVFVSLASIAVNAYVEANLNYKTQSTEQSANAAQTSNPVKQNTQDPLSETRESTFMIMEPQDMEPQDAVFSEIQAM